MKKYKTYQEALKKSIERDRRIVSENYHHIKIKHQDGSKFKIAHIKYEQIQINDLKAIVVYPEHNSVGVFMECDLESVSIQPWKGEKYKLKLQNLDAK